MKLPIKMISIALASTALAAAAPTLAEPSSAKAPALAAPSTEQLDLARRFVALTFSADDYVELMNEGSARMVAAMSGSLEDDGEVKALERHMNRYLAAVEPKVRANMPKLAEAYARIYARDYSAGELQQLIAFAQSPTGKRYLAAAASVDMDPLVAEAEEQLSEDLQPLMEDMQREMCAEKTAQRIAAGDVNAKCPLADKDATAAG